MKRFSLALFLVFSSIAFAQVAADESRCAAAAKRKLGDVFHIVTFGDLIGNSSLVCVVVIPYPGSSTMEIRVRSGFVIAWDGKQWRELLRFRDQIRNEQGYIGVDFIDPQYHYGFALRTEEHRSDRTQGFTMYFRFLDAKLKPEGTPIEVSWNPKVKRFEEYAANELDPPGFNPEVQHPPTHGKR